MSRCRFGPSRRTAHLREGRRIARYGSSFHSGRAASAPWVSPLVTQTRVLNGAFNRNHSRPKAGCRPAPCANSSTCPPGVRTRRLAGGYRRARTTIWIPGGALPLLRTDQAVSHSGYVWQDAATYVACNPRVNSVDASIRPVLCSVSWGLGISHRAQFVVALLSISLT